MKKFLIAIVAVATLQSCNNDTLTAINNDPNSFYSAVPEALLTYSQKQLTDYVSSPNVNINNFRLAMQYWQETTYLDESQYNWSTRNVSNQVWNYLYVRTLKNLNEAKTMVNDHVPTSAEAATWTKTKNNQLAILDLLQVYAYQLLVDTYGDIPYSQALDVDANPLPQYDGGAAIYTDLIKRTKADLAQMDGTVGSFSTGDNFYGGDVAKWMKFGNSLLLKLGMGIADVNGGTEAHDAVQAAITGGVFTSAADSALLPYFSSAPNYNQIYADVVASNRTDYAGASTMVNALLASNDPRISAYFQPVKDDDGDPIMVGGKPLYVGGGIGLASPLSSNSQPGMFAYTPTTPGILINYTEVAFYLAEAAARWTDLGLGAVAPLYNNAVSASFAQWGYSAADATTYLAAHPYDAGNWKKSIGYEAWVAMYNQPLTEWNFYRRLDYPVLAPAANADADANGMVPVRMKYPVTEQTTNPTNYAAGSSAIGGDHLYTKIFWDVN